MRDPRIKVEEALGFQKTILEISHVSGNDDGCMEKYAWVKKINIFWASAER